MVIEDKEDSVKSHQEIVHMIDEIRDFEDIKINMESQKEKKEVYEVKQKEFIDEIEVKNKDEKVSFLKKNRFFNETNKEINPAIFNIGFDKQGNLVNLDFKEQKPPEKENSKLNIDKFKKILKRKKGDKKESNDKEDKSEGKKVSKIKGKLGGIGKLKKIIPKKSKKEESPKESSE